MFGLHLIRENYNPGKKVWNFEHMYGSQSHNGKQYAKNVVGGVARIHIKGRNFHPKYFWVLFYDLLMIKDREKV